MKIDQVIKILINEYLARIAKELIESNYEIITATIIQDFQNMPIDIAHAQHLVQHHGLEGEKKLLIRGYTVQEKQAINDLMSKLERSDDIMNRCFAASYLHIRGENAKSTVDQVYQHYLTLLQGVVGKILPCVALINQGEIPIIPDIVVDHLFHSYSFTGNANVRWIIKSLEKLSHSNIRAFVEGILATNPLEYEQDNIDEILTTLKFINFSNVIDQAWWDDNTVRHHLDKTPANGVHILPLTVEAISLHEAGGVLLDNILQQAFTDAIGAVGNQVIVPVNLYNAHWAGLVIQNTAQGVHIIYNDPLGAPMPEFLASLLIDAATHLGIDLTPDHIVDLQIPIQNDGNNCGPLTVHTLNTIVLRQININTPADVVRAALTDGYQDSDNMGQILRLEMESQHTQTDPLDLILNEDIFIHQENLERLAILHQEESELSGILKAFFSVVI